MYMHGTINLKKVYVYVHFSLASISPIYPEVHVFTYLRHQRVPGFLLPKVPLPPNFLAEILHGYCTRVSTDVIGVILLLLLWMVTGLFEMFTRQIRRIFVS
jgi:hypothetical protein